MRRRTPEPIPHPRRLGEVGRAVADALQAHGVTGAHFYKSKHARAEFEVNGRTLVLHFPCTPSSPQHCARLKVKELEKLIAGARSPGPAATKGVIA